MKIKSFFFIWLLTSVLASCVKEEVALVSEPVDYVSTLVGTLSDFSLSNGNTYPATAMPWGMNFWTPQTSKMGDGWTYKYDAHHIRGIKQTHQPSPWINDYGQFSIMPVRDASLVNEDARQSVFSHKSETAKPYLYQVYLADHDVNFELTPSERAAAVRMRYPRSDRSGLIVDAFDKGSYLKFIPSENTIVGYTTKNSGGVPDNFKNWFVIKFDKKIESCTLFDCGKQVAGTEYNGEHIQASLQFTTQRSEIVNLRIASSFISLEQAYTNLNEVADKDFDALCLNAKEAWNTMLGRIKVGGGSDEQIRTFYSCLYRSLLFPRKFYEIDSDGKIWHYSPYNGQVCEGYMYTDTGFWDSFRALFPLLNLVYPSVSHEIQEGMANIARENDFLPEWSSPGHRGCMVGNNSASVVADATLKGLGATDIEALYKCILHGTTHVHPQVNSSGRLGHEYYNSLGYIPYNVGINENVARSLEYSYNDWCILQMARRLGRPAEEQIVFEKRALNYRYLFDFSNNLMRGKNVDGEFQSPFSPYKWGDAFTEGNSWHYSWSVFHDIQGLIDLHGGEKNFAEKLDSVFIVPPIYDDSYYGFRIHEITEMQVADMGNYAHGNQPAQHIIYLYDYAGEPWKTQFHAREVMDKLYNSAPDGYCGDEDNGQTSAWYVFSALGLYPVCPGSIDYAIGSPLFKLSEISLENGNTIRVSAPNNSKDNLYIDELQLNGKSWKHNYYLYEDLIKGAQINVRMSKNANLDRGTLDEDKPYSFSREAK